MRRIDNLIFVVLAVCILICVFLESQLSEYKLSQVTQKKVEQQNQTSSLPEPPPSESIVVLPDKRNIFKFSQFKSSRRELSKPQKEQPIEVSKSKRDERNALPKPELSTIVWNNQFSIVVINGEILARGDKDSKSRFRVETITQDRVRIRFVDNRKFVWLKIGNKWQDWSFSN